MIRMSGNKSNTTMRKKKKKSKIHHQENGKKKYKKRLRQRQESIHLDIRNQGEMRVDSGPGGRRKGRERASPTPARHPTQIKKWWRKREGKEGGGKGEGEGGKGREQKSQAQFGAIQSNPNQTKTSNHTFAV